jgi:hypothetical protein
VALSGFLHHQTGRHDIAEILLKVVPNTKNSKFFNDPDLVQAFLKKWCVESDFKAPNILLSLRFKCSGKY